MNSFTMENLTPFYADAGQQSRNVKFALPDDLRHSRRAHVRMTKDLTNVANAAKALDAIPEVGETLHLVCKGNFSAFDFIPAILRIAAPATIKSLDIVTLSFSKRNVQELVRMMDGGEIGAVQFLFGAYFKSSSEKESEFLFEQLGNRGASAAAVRVHAKLYQLELSDGRNVVIESSANLRSCRNIEQFTICDDRDLLLFHRAWITRVIKEANRERT